MTARVAFVVLILCCLARAAGGTVTAYVATFGPGPLAYERFGHNAILFVDDATGRSVAYDWGRFDFEQPNFLGRFLRGDMLYSTGLSDGRAVLDFYADTLGRSVVVQELNLSPAQVEALLEHCKRAYLPEHRDYRYDYFLSNCSTKVRDAVDAAVGGQLGEQTKGVASGTSFRFEAERHAAPDWALWFGFALGFSERAEGQIDRWNAAFVPSNLREQLAGATIAGEDGRPRPLVRREVSLSANAALTAPAAPPSRAWQTGLIGLAVAAVVLGAWRLRSVLGRLAASAWFVFAGLGGLTCVLIWAFTDHWSGHANHNLLALSPLGLPLAVMVLWRRWPRATRGLAAVHAGGCVVALLIFVLPWVGQSNAAVLAMAVPANLAASALAWRAAGRVRSTHADASPT